MAVASFLTLCLRLVGALTRQAESVQRPVAGKAAGRIADAASEMLDPGVTYPRRIDDRQFMPVRHLLGFGEGRVLMGGDSVMLDHGQAGWVRFVAVDKTQVYFTDISNVYSLPK